MTAVAVAFAALALAVMAVPVLVLALQVLAAWRAPAARAAEPQSSPRPRAAVVIPAHNEATGIGATLSDLLAQRGPLDRVIVVADNCSDDTAAVARRCGAEVLERHDLTRRGKGHALDHGVRSLQDDPPEVVVFVDADCRLAPGALEAIVRRAARHGRPVQALYLMHAPRGAGMRQRIAAFAWIVKNLVRPLGFSRLGLPCQLMGTGMAFTWPVLSRITLANSHLTEDMKLGVELALAGHPPMFAPEALVTSEFPVSSEGERTQRERWEHGHLDILTRLGPRLLWRGVRRADVASIGLAADLLVPPLTLLMMLVALVSVGVALVAWVAAVPALAAVALAMLALFFASIGLAWWRHGREVVSLGDLLAVPRYALAKIPMYLRFLVRRQSNWIRTRRHGE